MDRRPIGFFDSGIGGLTSIPYIMRMMPEERIIFFGDTARTPYGSKSPDTIRQFAMQIGDFMASKDVKMMVIACNTISSLCMEDLKERYPDIPVVGVIAPTAKVAARDCSPKENIGILATKATTLSGAYPDRIREKNPEMKNLFPLACPAFVPLIEEGIIDNEIMDLTIRHYLDDFMSVNDITTLVLGCTHYPLISENLRRLYPGVKLISSSKEVAIAVDIELNNHNLYSDRREGENVFYASDLSDNFVNMIQRILGKEQEELNIRFKNLEI